jgi:predicted CoA-substrate-specific enzyme activase
MKDIFAIDIGSVYVTIAGYIDGKYKRLLYKPHKGDYLSIIKQAGFNIEDVYFTGVNSFSFNGFHPFYVLTRYAERFGSVKHIIYVGASSYFLINLDEQGRYLGHESNTTCASGTGSFLDLQALRLGYTVEELGVKAQEAKVRPSISTRCSVFAKTDLIHLQQEGFKKDEIAAGLCYSMANNVFQSLFKGKKPDGKVLLTGGVFQNKTFLKAFCENLDGVEVVCENPECSLSFGLIHLAERGVTKKVASGHFFQLIDRDKFSYKHPPLKLKTQDYPDFSIYKGVTDEYGNEITFYLDDFDNKQLKVYMGIDIGSTSTKICIINMNATPLLSIYRKTSSDPIGAVKKIFKALKNIEKNRSCKFHFVGVATTGSGRSLIGSIIGADMIINEISAHAKAATFIDPEVDTIFEIGGQDSKYTQLKNGIVYHSVMNYVCAAGTGSFIEEQAEKLGIPIQAFSDVAEGSPSPPISDRCTVFMEKDIDLLITKGVPRNEIAAAVLHSVRDNYLNKVVGNNKIGDKIYFQGATARNRALIASFEQRLGKKIIVSPFCHVTGALGCAIYLWENNVNSENFVGLSFADKDTDIEKETCELCKNNCTLSLIKTETDVVAWGMKCGRDYNDKAPKRRIQNSFVIERQKLYKAKDKVYKDSLYVPDVLGNAARIHFIKELLENLEIKPVFIKPDKDAYNRGKKFGYYEICAPCIIAFGVIAEKKDSPVFMPYFLRSHIPENISQCHLCPYVQSSPSVIKHIFGVDDKFISPKIIESDDLDLQAEEIKKGFKCFVELDKEDIKKALTIAKSKNEEMVLKKNEMADRFFSEMDDNQLYVVVIGRPYIVYNERLNHSFIETIENYGIKAIPVDYLPIDYEFLSKKFPHIYWNYGQIILSALKYIAKYKNLFPVYLSAFSCGPDSFILNYFYREMQLLKKPFLTLQLDGHSAATGYLTRIEAAIESFKNFLRNGEVGGFSNIVYKENSCKIQRKKIYIPPMDVKGAELFASSFERFGIEAEVLKESAQSFSEGLKHSIGHECSPFHSTLGALLYKLKHNGNSSVSYFMPSGNGPCRFGQYGLLQKIITKELGFDVDIISPSGENAYGGLPLEFQKTLFDAVLMNDILRKIVLRLRPYEINKGEVDFVYAECLDKIKKHISQKLDYEKAFEESLKRFSMIKVKCEKKPKIGIVGEIYVRNNEFLNDNLIRTIELLGGEAMISSVLEWFFYTQEVERFEIRYMKGIDKFKKILKVKLKSDYYRKREHYFYSKAQNFFDKMFEPPIEKIINKGSMYLPFEFYGEAILTLGRAILFFEEDNADAVVNASPTFCMPGTISSYLLKEVSKKYNKPVIPLFYDKTGSPNLELIPYMEILKG